MKRGERTMYRTAGTTLIVGGLALASPLDELAVSAATAGIGAAISPIQGPATVALGLASVALGAVLISLAESE